MNHQFHHQVAAATATALVIHLTPETLTRQQRRRFQRNGWSLTWHTASD